MPENIPKDELLTVIASEEPEKIKLALEQLHPSEIADVLESLPKKERDILWKLIPFNDMGDVLSHAQDPVRAGILETNSRGRSS